MELHERLTAARPTGPAATREPFAELKNAVHLKVIGELGPQLFNVTLDPVESTTYTQLLKKSDSTPQSYYIGWCPDYYDQQDWLTTVFDSKSTISHTAWKNPQFDQLVESADKEPDTKKRDDMYLQASKILSQDAPVAFVYYGTTKLLVKPYVKNYYITALGFEVAAFTDVFVTKKT